MDNSTVEKNMKDGLWAHKPNENKKATGRFWKTFDRIFDPSNGQIIDNFIICRICKKINRYNSTKGNIEITIHYNFLFSMHTSL